MEIFYTKGIINKIKRLYRKSVTGEFCSVRNILQIHFLYLNFHRINISTRKISLGKFICEKFITNEAFLHENYIILNLSIRKIWQTKLVYRRSITGKSFYMKSITDETFLYKNYHRQIFSKWKESLMRHIRISSIKKNRISTIKVFYTMIS